MNSGIEVYTKINNYIVEATLSNSSDIKGDTLLFEHGYFDSMGLLFLIDFIRDKFHIDIKDTELLVENFESIKSIVAFVNIKLEIQSTNTLVICSK